VAAIAEAVGAEVRIVSTETPGEPSQQPPAGAAVATSRRVGAVCVTD
jgi:hypothetical protein